MAVRDSESRSAVTLTVVLGFVAAFAIALFEYRGSGVIGRFAVRWELARAFTLLAAWMPPLLFAACAASMSLHREQGLRFAELLRPVLIPALVLALVFSALELTVLPTVRRAQTSYESLSGLFREAVKDANSALQAGDLARARERVALSGAIDSTESDYKRLAEHIQQASLKAEPAAGPAPAAKAALPKAPDTGASAYEFYKRADAYFRAGDYYSAHWYAGKALALDPSRRDARQLQAEAWERITAPAENPEDKTRSDFYVRKAAAYALLQSGDSLGAYRAFMDLARENPKDPDVARYRKESLDRLAEEAFFAEDFRRAFAGGGKPGFTVRVASEGAEHVLLASRAAVAGPFLYLEGFEYMTAGPGGPTLHVRAPYARLRSLSSAESEGSEKVGTPPVVAASLRMVERAFPSEVTQPRYILGRPTPPGETLILLPMDFDALSLVLDLQDDASRIPFFRLLDGDKVSRAYGLDPIPYRMETALRISIPVVLMTLVLLGTALGARFRRDEEPGRIRLMIALPILAILSSVPLSAANRAGHYILVRLFSTLSAAGAIAVWTGLLCALLALSLLAVGRLGVHASD